MQLAQFALFTHLQAVHNTPAHTPKSQAPPASQPAAEQARDADGDELATGAAAAVVDMQPMPEEAAAISTPMAGAEAALEADDTTSLADAATGLHLEAGTPAGRRMDPGGAAYAADNGNQVCEQVYCCAFICRMWPGCSLRALRASAW